jgi:hypothetical protein
VLEAAAALSKQEGRKSVLRFSRVCYGGCSEPRLTAEGLGFCTDLSVEACGGSERESVKVPAASGSNSKG